MDKTDLRWLVLGCREFCLGSAFHLRDDGRMPPLKPQISEIGGGVSSFDNTTFLSALYAAL